MTDTIERTEAEAEQTAPEAETSADSDTEPGAIDDPIAGTSDHPAEAVDKATGEVVAVPTEADWLKIHAANQAEVEAWKRVSVSELNLPNRVNKAMGKAGLLYIGDIEKVREELGDLQRVNGIGESSAELIESAMLKFWAEHPAGIAARKVAAVPDAKASADAPKNENATN